MVLALRNLAGEAAGAMVMHRLPDAAGVRRRSRDRQGHRGKSAHQQQNQQYSGSQAVHEGLSSGKLLSKA